MTLFEPINDEINLRWIRQFVTAEETAELLDTARHVGYKPSTVITTTPNAGTLHPNRTSESCWLNKAHTPLIRRLEDAVMRITGCAYDDIEPFQVVKYEHTQRYDTHFDYFDPVQFAHEIRSRGQRTTTILLYLQCPVDGGGTFFPRLTHGLTVIPSVGDAVMWDNCIGTNPNPLSEHGGLPVRKGTKVAVNIWIRKLLTNEIIQ